jgi:hypothetical protein
MTEAFDIKYKKKTKDEDYEFPMQIPYIAKMQDKDKLLMKELMKSDHKYKLTKSRTYCSVDTELENIHPDGNKKLCHRMISSVPLPSGSYAHQSNNRGHCDVARIS